MAERRAPTPPPPDTSTRPDPPPPPPPRLVDTAERPRPAAAAPEVSAGVQSLIKRDDTMAVAFQGLVPSSIGEAMILAQHLAKSKAVPKSLQGEPESVFTIIMAGMEVGLTPIRAIQSIAIISGNLAFKADLQLAQVRRSGALEFFDEGFELCDKTDGNLEDRLRRVGRSAAECDELERLAGNILDLTDEVPEGKPYGWAIAQRKGDHQKHVRVFTWLDAERFKFSEWEGPDNNRRKVDKKLSEKHAYVNNPQDMYPKRARVRVLQVTHSDVLAGMPAIEAMDGMVIDGEVVRSEAAPESSEDAIAARLASIKEKDEALALSIQTGFDQLQMGIAKRLMMLTKHEADPNALLNWMKDEYAARATRGQAGRKRSDVLGGEQPATETKQPAATEPVKQPAPPTPPNPDQDTGREIREGGMSSLKSIADGFKKSLRTF